AQACQRVDAGPPERALLVRARARPPGVLDDDDQIIEAGELGGRRLKPIWMGHQLEQQVPLLQGMEHSGLGEGCLESAHRSDPTEPWSPRLPIEELDGLGHRAGWREAADDGVRTAAGMGVCIELDSLLDRVTTGRGGDVDEVLDVPYSGLGLIGAGFGAAAHPR